MEQSQLPPGPNQKFVNPMGHAAMARSAPIDHLTWSPIINVGFLTVPICAGLLGGYFNLPLLAVALCVPQSGYIGWFYRRPGAIVIAALSLIAWWLPAYLETNGGKPFNFENALIGPLIIFLFASINSQLRRFLDSAHEHAKTDSLTGLLNRSGFENRLSEEINRGIRCRTPLAVVFMDVDEFKQFNDKYGHMVGDELLNGMADVFRNSTRNYDATARLGGDEFTLLFPATDLAGTEVILQRLSRRLNEYAANRGWNLSWSMGAVVFPYPDNPEAMIHAADEMMYEVKRQGKGQIRVKEWTQAEELVLA